MSALNFKNIEQEKEILKGFIAQMNNDHGVDTTIYSLGFSEEHDATLLNFLAQSGSQLGNFIFIDTKTFAAMASFYSLSATKTDGSTFEMKDCVGKVVYATNVASK